MELLLVSALPFGLAHRQWGDPVLPIMVGDSPVLFVALVVVPLFGLLLYALRFPQPLPLPSSSPALAAAASVLIPALAWTALDLVRTKFDPGGLWGPLFLSQHDTAAARLASLGGPWLVTFALVAVAYAAALVLVRARGAVRVVPAALALTVGLVALPLAAATGAPASGTIAVAAVQPGYDTAEFDRPVLRYLRVETRDHERASLDLIGDLAPLTREAADRGAAVTVWPEATVWVDPNENAAVRQALVRLARETDLVIVVPYFIRSRAEGAAVAVLPDGAITEPQPKQRPMWFLGEKGGNRAVVRPVETGLARLGTLLGVDNQDPASPRTLAVRGASVISSSTHDWAQLAPQQQAFAQVHAAALDVPLVRADWRYGSAVFDAGGRKRADAGREKRRAVVVADVAARAAPTAYGRVGDAFGWLAVGAVVAATVGGWWRRRVRRRASVGSGRRAPAA